MTVIKIKQRTTGKAGAPGSLQTGEPAISAVDNVLYVGVGDDGTGTATSVVPYGGPGAYVDKNSDQTISGTKTFQQSPKVPTLETSNSSTSAASTAFVAAKIAESASASAEKLTTARTINGVAFDGSKNIEIASSTAQTLATPRLINGVAFDGSKNIEIASSTAQTLATPRLINGVAFDGSDDITVPPIGNASTATTFTNPPTLTISGAASGVGVRVTGNTPIDVVLTDLDVSKATAGTLPVARGGTGLDTLTSGRVLVGNGTGAVTSRAIDTAASGTSGSSALISSGAVNAGLALKANLASPALTGTPTAPTAAAGTNTTQLANTAFVTSAVSSAVSQLLGSAPSEALDTLKELGDALGNDANFAATVTNALSTKVDKVSGKGLSTNDFSAALLSKLNGIEANANNFALPSGTNGQVLKHNGTTWVAGSDANTTYSNMTSAEGVAGTATTGRLITPVVLKEAIVTHTPAQTTDSITALLPVGTNGQVLKHNGTTWTAGADTNTTYSAMSAADATTGTATAARTITAAVLKGAITTHAPTPTTISGNAGTATKLATARTINGVSFDGSANITVTAAANGGAAATAAKLVTTRALTVGSTAKNFDGSAAVSWSLAEIGAAASSHTHTIANVSGLQAAIDAKQASGNGVSARFGSIELYDAKPYIDFHYGNSTADYTSRILESASGTLTCQGHWVASGNVTAYSDVRLKKDLIEINNALSKVQQLTGYTYTRIDTGERQTGLIAQDVQKVLPEAVQENEDRLSVAYGNLVGLLVEAIKELNAKVEALESGI